MNRIIIVITLTTLALSSMALSNNKTNNNMERATFGAGCFWCTEAIFERVKGVETVTSGY
ncbi:MAG: peptide-methionine (S)-S-oxide reductase, partial [Bacteroidales bacterium]|nr:peptide-methionine (S)-S-oxide reductase [Bacteroidales bacterium]